MSRFSAMTFYTPVGFPRVSGDEPSPALCAAAICSFSPRERG